MADQVNSILSESEGLRGLLISLLSLMDVDKTRTLTKHEYVQAAGPLGFDVTDEAWSSLCARFGNETTRTNGQENDDDTHLDLNMIGAYFVNKYDPLLEEIIRRLLIGIVNNSVRSTRLEARLRTVEEHLESTSMREIREREMRINKTLRRWRQQSISVAFDSWKETVAKSREVRERAIRHMMNQALSSTWRRWKEMVSEVQEQRAAVGRAVARIRNRAAALAFEVRSRLRRPPTHTQQRLSHVCLSSLSRHGHHLLPTTRRSASVR